MAVVLPQLVPLLAALQAPSIHIDQILHRIPDPLDKVAMAQVDSLLLRLPSVVVLEELFHQLEVSPEEQEAQFLHLLSEVFLRGLSRLFVVVLVLMVLK